MGIKLKDAKKVLAKKRASGDDGVPSFIQRKVDTKYTTLSVKDITYKAYFGAKQIAYTGIVKSEGIWNHKDIQPNYKVSLIIEGIKFTQKKVGKDDIAAYVGNKQMYYKPPSIDKSVVRLRCQCLDFQHRFSHELKDQKALIGRPKKYVRKTPLWTKANWDAYLAGKGDRPYPYANATGKIGFCKHIYSFVKELKKLKFVSEK